MWIFSLNLLRVAIAVEVTCPQTKRLGNSGDGGWNICLAGGFNFKKPCLVYSFGQV